MQQKTEKFKKDCSQKLYPCNINNIKLSYQSVLSLQFLMLDYFPL